MTDRIDADQYYFLSFKCPLSCVLHPVNILPKSESIRFPQKWSVGKEDMDAVGKNQTVKRVVSA
jgi:hypothetical protein